MAQHNKCFKWFPQNQLKKQLKKLFNPFMASIFFLVEHPFWCHDLLQMRSITRHQLLAAFLRNLSPFLMSNGLQYSNILGFTGCAPSSNPIRDFLGFKSGDCDGQCRIFQNFLCNQALVEFEVCLGLCPVGRSNDAQASASSLTE